MDIGHWHFPHDFNIEDWHGFIYRITNTKTNQEYIGKKSFWSITRKKIKNRKNRKVVKKESDWKSYTGSSTHLNKDIQEFGKDNFIFQIESLHETKASLYYAEVEKQILENVLRAKLSDGTKKFYNGQVGAVKFIPPEQTLNESNMRLK